ncbi:MAG: histidine phosphatase family protein [Candidatus Gracilibacteria bacterium]|nr:histidine phosphatase family protein [Candidatus Gracilibacteria bacterium]
MKTLILIRHAKSDWDNRDIIDFERVLSKRGIKEIEFVGKILKKLDLKTDLILCSSAIRTRETLEGIWQEIDANNKKIEYVKGVYDNHMALNMDYYLELLGNIDDKNDTVAMVGHNTFITNLLRQITGNEYISMETLGIAIINFDINNWRNISKTRGTLVFFLSPKHLMNM